MYFTSAIIEDIMPLNTAENIAKIKLNGFSEVQILKKRKSLLKLAGTCLGIACVQLLLTFYTSAYHTVHLSNADTDRAASKTLMKFMLIEGILLEIIMIVLTAYL